MYLKRSTSCPGQNLLLSSSDKQQQQQKQQKQKTNKKTLHATCTFRPLQDQCISQDVLHYTQWKISALNEVQQRSLQAQGYQQVNTEVLSISPVLVSPYGCFRSQPITVKTNESVSITIETRGNLSLNCEIQDLPFSPIVPISDPIKDQENNIMYSITLTDQDPSSELGMGFLLLRC